MKFGKALLAPACLGACLLSQACVEYVPDSGGVPAPPPPGMAPYSESPGEPPAPPSPPPPQQAGDNRLDALVGPIALYPDPLVAIILPASTVPSDVSSASAYLIQDGDASQIDSQPWDPSVRALAHYPTVLTWMANNTAWTQALGAAFISSPSDVMASIQHMRERAMVSGALAPSPQEQVVSDGGDIEIIPAQPDAICVPYYDPDSVFAEGPYYGPPIYYGPVYPAGVWLSYSVDWHRRSVWVGGPDGHRGPGGWHDPRQDGGRPPQGARAWHAPSGPHANFEAPGSPVPRPRPLPGAPTPPAARQREENPRANPARGEPRPQGQAIPAPSPGRAPTQQGSRGSAQPTHQEPTRGSTPAATAPTDPRNHAQPNN
jgi:hypothetical protein